MLVGSLGESEELAYARIEGVEDLDLIVRKEDSWLEQYVQIKSREEGAGSWTIASLEQEGVFSRFSGLFNNFQATSHDEGRSIELILVVEGDLARDVQQLKQGGSAEKQSVFAILATSEIAHSFAAYKPAIRLIQDLLKCSASELLAGLHNKNSSDWITKIQQIAKETSLSREEIEATISGVIPSVVATLDEFLRVIRFQSRASGTSLLQDAAITRIMQVADVAVSDARNALDRLLLNIAEESSRTSPTLIDRNLLLSWLGLTDKPALRKKPEIVPDYVERTEFTKQFAKIMASEEFVLLYGPSKIGKSQFVSRYIELSGYAQRYLWFTFSGEPDDGKRLLRDLAATVGNIASVWQLAEDVEAGTIDRQSFLNRLAKVPMDGILLVLDDSHRCSDPTLFAAVKTAISGWKRSKLLLLSEGKVATTEAIAAKQIPFPGLNPPEAMKFILLQKIDPRDALLDLAALVMRFDGHPLMLKAICQALPPKPTPEDVKILLGTLPSLTSAKIFLEYLSNQLFFRLLRTSEQRLILSRLALLPGRFDWGMAQAVAAVEPKVTFTLADWRYMKSVVLDEVDLEHCLIPQLLKEIAKDNLPTGVPTNQILIAAAHRQLRPGGSRKLEFIDFHAAILSLILGEANKQAAAYFVMSVPRLLEFTSFSDLEVLFMVLNGELFHAKLGDPHLRWQLLSAELMSRAQDSEAAKSDQVSTTLSRMRQLERKQRNRWPFRWAILTLIVLIRSRRIDASSSPPTRHGL